MRTPGPWVFGSWQIYPEDRVNQSKGLPYWTLCDGDDVMALGPIGRKSLQTDSIICPVGYEADSLNVSEEDKSIITAAPDMYDILKELYENGGLAKDKYGKVLAILLKAEGK